MRWLEKNISFLRYVAVILAAILILIFIFRSYYSPYGGYSPYGNDACMQANSGSNPVLNYILLIAALLLLFYAIAGINRGKSSMNEASVLEPTSANQEIENKSEEHITILPENMSKSSNGDLATNENNKLTTIEMLRKLLNEDEFKLVEIILDNEGITQDSIHFRTGFSHSKISMIMKKLEERDLIVREKFGKTYKVYLSEWIGGERNREGGKFSSTSSPL